MAESRDESQKGDVFITQPLMTSVDEKAPAMQSFEVEFLSKKGRAISPLEANAKATDESFGLNESEHDQLYQLKKQIAIKDLSHSSIKKGVKMLEKIIWRKQTHQKFAVVYAIKVTNEIKAQVENLNTNVKGFGPMSTISAGSGSKNDDSTSMG